jgi:uncharacterized protein YbjT (DUF2867 family)
MNLDQEYRFCADLPTTPRPEMGKILVTGATGYIGGRLVPELLDRGYTVIIMVRRPSPELAELWPDVDMAVADALDLNSLKRAMEGIHTAYYLIHSLLLGPKRFEFADVQAAINFRVAAAEMGVQRIIYLGGLGDVHTHLSPHLRSRIEVARELSKGPAPVTILRAAIILGSGSASYEILYNVVKKMPFVLIPHWTKTQCQPIAIRDVIKYLVGVLEAPETSGRAFDIGGKDILTYGEMIRSLAELLGKRTFFIPSRFTGFRPYAVLASLFAPVPSPVIWSLLEGLRSRVVCQDNEIRKIIPFEPLSFRESILRAMSREEQDNVRTRWTDAYPPAHRLAIKLHELTEPPRFTVAYSLITPKSVASLFKAVCSVGGREGWFENNWMWRLRGTVDVLLGGVGITRGRKSSSRLRINDVIDFWRVEDLKDSRRLLLRAEMKLPGRAWLEFSIEPVNQGNQLSIKAYFQPRGLMGKIYWYVFLPFHHTIFEDLLKQIERKGLYIR